MYHVKMFDLGLSIMIRFILETRYVFNEGTVDRKCFWSR